MVFACCGVVVVFWCFGCCWFLGCGKSFGDLVLWGVVRILKLS